MFYSAIIGFVFKDRVMKMVINMYLCIIFYFHIWQLIYVTCPAVLSPGILRGQMSGKSYSIKIIWRGWNASEICPNHSNA